MNRLILFAFTFLVFTEIGFSQTDTISTNIYQYNGKMGIGTSLPRAPLHIKHPGIEYTNSGLILENNAGTSIYGVINSWNHFWIGYNDNVSENYPNNSFQHRIFIHENGNVGIGTVHPNARLDVSGTVKATGFYLTDGTSLGSSKWNSNENDIFYQNGNVGIGTSSPNEKLEVTGAIKASKFMLNDGSLLAGSKWLHDTNNVYLLTEKVGIGTAKPRSPLHIKHPGIEYTNSGLIFENKEGSSIYGIINTWNHFWIGYNDNVSENYPNNSFQHRIFIHENGNVGIGTVHPNARLDVSGTVKATGFYLTDGTSLGSSKWNSNENDIFYQNGKVGIGTTTPNTRLEITDGDVYINDIEKGIIMKSPDGRCWRGKLDNSGILNFQLINCPESSITNQEKSNNSNYITIYPNPSEGSITLGISDFELSKLSYSIYSLDGKLLSNNLIKSNLHKIDISSLTKGLYLLNITDKNGNIIKSENIIKN